jgi:membrane protein implicated in regulation of membrane protease activity
MTWEMFYLICFCIGLALAALSLAGGFHHHLHIGHHHLPSAGRGHGADSNSVGTLNGFTLTAFLCWFGGAGYLMERYGGLWTPVILALATLSGLAAGAVILWFLARVLAPHDKALTAEDTEIVGVIGRVSGTIRSEGTGEILYSQNGARCSSPARSDTGEPIARDMEVVVMRYERGVAYVRRWDELAGGESLTPDMGGAQT